jgi:hypothetical protein
MSRRLPAVFAVLLAVLAAGSAQAAAKTYLVSTPADTEPAAANPTCAAPCSLRQAIQDANAAGEPEDIVDLEPGKYALVHGSLLLLPKSGVEKIVGLAARAAEVEIKGENTPNSASVLSIGAPAAVPEVEIATVKITESHSHTPGGAINISSAKVALTDVAVEGNVAQEAGGGIEMAAGRLSVADTVIAGNTVEGTPGTGGGIDVKAGSVVLANDTLAGNTAPGQGGGIYNAGELRVNGATIAGNEAAAGGGLAGSKPAELVNTILALNGHKDCAIELTDPLGHNLADDGTCKLTEAGDKPEATAGLALLEGAPKPTPLLADNGGFTETIALQSGSAAIAAGSESACLATDQRGVARPLKLCDIGAFQLVEEPERPSSSPNPGPLNRQPPPTGGPPPPPPAPVLARTGNVAPASGTVLVELPGTHTFVALTSLRSVPFGTVIDATHGRVVVTTAAPHGGTQTGEFFGGKFVLTQKRGGEVVAVLTGGDFASCPTARERGHRASVAGHRAWAASAGKHPVRKLWANAHGKFSTKGNYAAGAVEGTEWLTEDFCNGTLIRVTRDKVNVTNLVNHRHFLVKAGHSRFAKAP